MARWGGTAVVESWGGTLAFLKEYWAALRNTHQIFWRIAFRRRTLEEELQEVRGWWRRANVNRNGPFEISSMYLGLFPAGPVARQLAQGFQRL